MNLHPAPFLQLTNIIESELSTESGVEEMEMETTERTSHTFGPPKDSDEDDDDDESTGVAQPEDFDLDIKVASSARTQEFKGQAQAGEK